MVLGATSSILLFRYLGSRLVGEYSALYAYLALFGWLATFGMDAVLVREAARRREAAGEVVGSGIAAGLGLALLATGIALAAAPIFGYGHALPLLLLAAVEVLLLAPLRFPAILFQVDLRQWIGVIIAIGRQLAWLAAAVLLVLCDASLFTIVLVRVGCAVLEFSAILRSATALLSDRLRVRYREVCSIVLQAAPLAISGLAVGIYHRVDQVMLHKLAGDITLGHYVAAVNLVESFAIIPSALMTSLFPVLSRSVVDSSRFDGYLGLSYRYLVTMVCGFALTVSLLAPVIIRLIYGRGFDESGNVLSVLVWSQLSVCWGVIISNAIIAQGLQAYLPIGTVAGALTNLGLNLVLIPKWGATGAAWATVVSYAIGGVVVFLFLRPTRRISRIGLASAGVPIALAIVLLAITLRLPMTDALKGIVALTVFFAGLVLTRTLHARDLGRIRRIVGSNS
jgi:PST family polysaccharide transporter